MNDLPLVSMGVHCTHCWHRIELCICPASHPWWFDSDDSLSPIMPLRVSGSITVTIPRENASRILDIMLGRRPPEHPELRDSKWLASRAQLSAAAVAGELGCAVDTVNRARRLAS